MLGALPGVLLTFIALFLRDEIAGALGFGAQEGPLIGLAAWILAVDTLAVVPYAFLRMERRVLMFAFLKILGIVATVIMTIVFVVLYGHGAIGVFAANAFASAGVAGMLLMMIWSSFRREGPEDRWVDGGQLKGLLRFGIPLVPAGLAGIALQVIDRPIVRALTDDATVGLYQLNARLAIFMMLAVGMFDFAWRPFFLQHANDADAKQLYAKVFTYFSAFLLSMFLLVSMFVEDLVRFPMGGRTFFPEFYWQGTAIVPVFLAANMLTGAYIVFLTGVYLSKRTGMVPVISGTAAIVAIAGNLLLVPGMGIMGAALAALAGHLVQTIWMYAVGQRLFPVAYDWRKVIPLLIWTCVLYVTVRFLDPVPLTYEGTATKLSAFVLFLVSLFVTRVVSFKGIRAMLLLRSRTGDP